MKTIATLSMIMLSVVSAAAQNTFPASGNVGIGTTNPESILNTYDSGASKDADGPFGGGVLIQSTTGGRSSSMGAELEFAIPDQPNGGPTWGQGRIITVAGDSLNYPDGEMILGTRRFFNKLGTGSYWYYDDDLTINSIGNVGIGTTSPGAVLEVNGNVRLIANSGAALTFQDGTVQSTAFTGALCGGVYAESVDVTGDRTHYEPGDVIRTPLHRANSSNLQALIRSRIRHLFDEARRGGSTTTE